MKVYVVLKNEWFDMEDNYPATKIVGTFSSQEAALMVAKEIDSNHGMYADVYEQEVK